MMFLPTPLLALIEGLGGPELILVVLLVLVLFGGKSLPEFARGLGRAMREFKKATSGVEDELRKAMDETNAPARPAPRPLPAPRAVAKDTTVSVAAAAPATPAAAPAPENPASASGPAGAGAPASPPAPGARAGTDDPPGGVIDP